MHLFKSQGGWCGDRENKAKGGFEKMMCFFLVHTQKAASNYFVVNYLLNCNFSPFPKSLNSDNHLIKLKSVSFK